MKKVTNGTFTGAASYLDDAYIEEAAESRMNAEIKNEKNKARILPRRARRWLIPAVAALLIAAILIPTLIVMNRAPEPTAPAQNGAEGQAPEDEPQNDPAALPTEQTEPTEPTAEDPATETESTTEVRPVWIPKTNGQSGQFLSVTYDTPALRNEYLVVKITGITNETKELFIIDPTYRQKHGDGLTKFTRLDYEPLYCHGSFYHAGQNIALSQFAYDYMLPLYYPTADLKSIKEGDVVIFGVYLRCRSNKTDDFKEYDFFAKCVPDASKDWNDFKSVVTNDKLDFSSDPDSKLWNFYDKALDYIQSIIDEGYDAVNKDLTARIPTARLYNGCTVEEFIEICEWYKDFLEVLEEIRIKNSTGVIYVF